ncbi:multicilin [Salvelinus sp. IW2-2015]|uniref:multicilin n=1 Tax=Salvelinus sp. IW2-2015 TaxID=2691554 RepID=UPI0038D4242F
MHGDRKVFRTICPNTVVPHQNQDRRQTAARKGRPRLPRSSSPVAVYVDRNPCIVEEAFATIAWDDLEECASVMRRESDSLGSQVNDSDGDDQEFGEYALDFIADSPSHIGAQSVSADLVAFQGLYHPPLTPQRSPVQRTGPAGLPFLRPRPRPAQAQDGILWRALLSTTPGVLGHTLETKQPGLDLHMTVSRRQEEINALQQRNVHLRELATRAKHLASVLDVSQDTGKQHALHVVREPSCFRQPPASPCDEPPMSMIPCKRQRLDDTCDDTSPPGCVEDILRDVSDRCNTVLHHSTAQLPLPQDSDPERILMFGAFSGLQTSRTTGGAVVSTEDAEAGESSSDSSFRTSIREHCTIRTQTFPHGHAFTSRTTQGGYRFRWVPSQS